MDMAEHRHIWVPRCTQFRSILPYSIRLEHHIHLPLGQRHGRIRCECKVASSHRTWCCATADPALLDQSKAPFFGNVSWWVARFAIVANFFTNDLKPLQCLEGSLLWKEFLADHFIRPKNTCVKNHLNIFLETILLVSSLSPKNQTAY